MQLSTENSKTICRTLFFSLLILGSVYGPQRCFAASYVAAAGADAFVASGAAGNLRNNNYGGGGALAIAASGLPNGEFQSVIRFDLSSSRNSLDAQYGAGQWSVQDISLQLSSSPHSNAIYNEVSAGRFGVSLMRNNSWVEGTGNASSPSAAGISFNTLQSNFINPSLDPALGTFNFDGGTSGLNQYSLDLGSGLNSELLAGGTVSLRLFAADSAISYLFSSRAASSLSTQPQLLITAIPEPSALALFAAGLVVLLWMGVFRKERQKTEAATS
jgi:hypothetical protein